MHKNYRSLGIVLAISALCAAGGAFLTPPEPAQKSKILLLNSGGRVVFNHRKHAEDQQVECQVCHHESIAGYKNIQPCGSCHGLDFDAAFRAGHQAKFPGNPYACLTCHHTEFTGNKWDSDLHDLHAESFAESCQDCHHGESMEAEPDSCSYCHARMGPEKKVPSASDPLLLRGAVHVRCAGCHAHAECFESGLDGCASCHQGTDAKADFIASGQAELPQTQVENFSDCAACHYAQPIQESLPGRMTAFHRQCGNCHQNSGKGPSVEQDNNQCLQCHIR